MKRLLLSITMCFLFLAVDAQEESKWPPIDKSVLDAATYPRAAAWRNYMGEEDRNLAPRARVVYSRPKMNERKIFGELVPFGKEKIEISLWMLLRLQYLHKKLQRQEKHSQ